MPRQKTKRRKRLFEITKIGSYGGKPGQWLVRKVQLLIDRINLWKNPPIKRKPRKAKK